MCILFGTSGILNRLSLIGGVGSLEALNLFILELESDSGSDALTS